MLTALLLQTSLNEERSNAKTSKEDSIKFQLFRCWDHFFFYICWIMFDFPYLPWLFVRFYFVFLESLNPSFYDIVIFNKQYKHSVELGLLTIIQPPPILNGTLWLQDILLKQKTAEHSKWAILSLLISENLIIPESLASKFPFFL